MAKPKIGDKVHVIKFGGYEIGKVIDYSKVTNRYTVLVGNTKWSLVPYKKPDKFKGPLYIEKTI